MDVIIQPKDDVLDQGDSIGDDSKWSYSGYILKAEMTVFADELYVRYERETEKNGIFQYNSQNLAWATGKR